MALADMESSLKELQRINGVLERVLNKLDVNERKLKMSTEGVMKTFFNILLTHKKLCNETDRIKAAEYVDIDMRPNAEYTELFRKFELETLKTPKVSILKKYIDCKNKPEEICRTCYLIFKYDKSEKMFFYEKFGLIYSDEEKERVIKLGLTKLIL